MSTTFDAVVVARDELAQDVAGLTLAHADGQALPRWDAGAHIDLLLPEGRTRQYSLCGDVDDAQHYRIGVLREPAGRGGSQWVHEHLRPGTRLRIGAPRNHFALVPARRYLFVAGGIGITPMLPMVAAAERAGTDWQLVYGGRSLSSMAFVRELAAHGERVLLHPQDRHGLLDIDALLKAPDATTAIYACGPAGLLAALKTACARHGWRPDALHVEHFAAQPSQATDSERAFDVELRKSGLRLTVAPGQSIAEALEAAGIAVPLSCGVGSCGTCESRVLAGTPEHRDCVLTDSEREAGQTMMVCVSRAKSDLLVMDL